MTSILPRMAGSPDEEILLDHLERHVEDEQEILDSYTALAQSGPDHVRYLVGLITDDEERHHRILREMANRINGDISYRDVGPTVPYMRFGDVDRDRLIAETNRFLEIEKQDLRGLKELGKLLHKQRFGGLFPLLVRLMELDTKKHRTILEFIADTTRHPDR